MNISDVIQDVLLSDSRVYQSEWDTDDYNETPEILEYIISARLQVGFIYVFIDKIYMSVGSGYNVEWEAVKHGFVGGTRCSLMYYN